MFFQSLLIVKGKVSFGGPAQPYLLLANLLTALFNEVKASLRFRAFSKARYLAKHQQHNIVLFSLCLFL